MRHRIVQYRGKRFSLKLDDVVWQCLEEFAAASGLRLNQFVAQVAEGATDELSITGAIRVFCLQQALERIRRLERQLEDRSMAGRGVSLATLAEAIPAPCFVVSQDHLIERANQPAQAWVGARESALIGKSLEHYFQSKAELPLSEIVARFRQGRATVFPAQILYLRPGRVIMAKANFCPGVIKGPDELLYLVLIDATRRA